MAALDFPASPTVGQQATLTNGFTYQWDGTVWSLAAGTNQAAGGDLAGTYPNPTIKPSALPWTPSGTVLTPTDPTKSVNIVGTTAASHIIAGSSTIKGRMRYWGAVDQLELSVNRTDVDGQDSAAKPSWAIAMGPNGDGVSINRKAPGGAWAASPLLALDNLGNLTVPQRHLGRAYGVSIDNNNVTQSIPSNAGTQVTLPRANYDPWGLSNVSVNQIVTPANFGSQWVIFNARFMFSAGNLTQCWGSIDWWTGSAWSTQACAVQGAQSIFQITWITTSGPNTQWRLQVYHNSGAAQSLMYAWLAMMVLGSV